MELDVATRKKLKIARAKCDKSLMFFTRFFFKELRGSKFLTNWHHEDICGALDDIGAYKYELLNINIPPRFSKTELVLNFIARSLGENPAANFLYITASDELRNEVSTRIRDIITHPYFRYMYGVELKKDQKAKNLWRTEQGGGLKTATIFGQITGFGAGQMTDFSEDETEAEKEIRGKIQDIDILLMSDEYTPEGRKVFEDQKKSLEYDLELAKVIRNFEGSIVLDDINKVDDSENLTAINEKVKRIIFNTVLSRKNSDDTPIINIQQRVGTEDATAVLCDHYEESGDSHKVLNLVFPIINTHSDESRGIVEGDSLWAFKMPIDKIEQLKNSPYTSRVFVAQYMQDPQGRTGEVFTEEHFIIMKASELPFDPNAITKNFVIDGAFKDEERHDESAQGSFYFNRIDGNMYVFNICGVRKNLDKYLTWFRPWAEAQGIKPKSRLYIELKASGDNLKTMLRKPLFGGFNTIGVNDKFVNQGKMFRAESTLPFGDAGKIILVEGAWNRPFIDQCLGFPHAKHDDMVDVLSYMGYYSFIKRQTGGATNAR